MLRLMSRALHFPVDWGCFCPCSAALCFLGAPGFMRFSQPLTRSLTVSCTQTHMLDKRVVFLNMLSSVRIPLSAFLRSAFHRHFIFLLQTPADRRSFFSVSAFSWSVSSFHIHFLFFKLLFLIDIYPTLGGGWGCFSRRSPKCAPFSLITLSFYEVLVAGFLLVPLASVSFV